ncbi:acetyltransferase [Mucilaginibacter flavidus]|uniref:acetyltransferase n=1 Tax=Mucilaginibacter flavidus TaxID=2949309 RepID=UPI00209226AF|nr:acetyltransferase [Mucilaginibacter flavidus]MCO5949289.1 acetyltransferase [Mucilaginibacter flavidus]
MLKKKLILIGGGGHCKSCIDVIRSRDDFEINGILDNGLKLNDKVLDCSVIGNDIYLDELINIDTYFLITIGQIKSAVLRQKIFNILTQKGANIATVISSRASVSGYSKIGKGTILHHFCAVNAQVNIGENNIINTGANIEHDVQIGNNNHISTGVVLNGNVSVGNNCFIGSGSVIANGVKIADNVVIGAGSLVIKNIVEAGIYAGSPIKAIKDE